MNVFDVNVLGYDEEKNEYEVQYCIHVKPGVVRRTKAVYNASCKGLSRDYEGGKDSELFHKVTEAVDNYDKNTQRI